MFPVNVSGVDGSECPFSVGGVSFGPCVGHVTPKTFLDGTS